MLHTHSRDSNLVTALTGGDCLEVRDEEMIKGCGVRNDEVREGAVQSAGS